MSDPLAPPDRPERRSQEELAELIDGCRVLAARLRKPHSQYVADGAADHFDKVRKVLGDVAVPARAHHEEKGGVVMNTFPARQRLLNALATMPEEAFGWLVLMLQPPKENRPHASPWPDGLGGFMDASRAAITETQAAAKAYIEGDGK